MINCCSYVFIILINLSEKRYVWFTYSVIKLYVDFNYH